MLVLISTLSTVLRWGCAQQTHSCQVGLEDCGILGLKSRGSLICLQRAFTAGLHPELHNSEVVANVPFLYCPSLPLYFSLSGSAFYLGSASTAVSCPSRTHVSQQ